MTAITHRDIDERLLGMVRLCVEKIDADPHTMTMVRANIDRIADPRIKAEWRGLSSLPWAALRERLLSQSPDGDQLRQNAPLGGVLTKAERLAFFRPLSDVTAPR